MNKIHYENCFDAIRDAGWKGKTCIGYDMPKGWVLYDPVLCAPTGVTPEFLCLNPNIVPIPLSDNGFDILREWFNRLNLSR